MKKIWLITGLLFIYNCGGGGGGGSSPAEPVINPPTIQNVSVVSDEDTDLSFNLTSTSTVAVTYILTSQPQNGTATITTNVLNYSPNENWNGTESFAYIASNSAGNSLPATITITVNPIDDEPITKNVSATTDEDSSVEITLEADEFDGQSIVFNLVNDASNGSVTISNNTATYTPNQDWSGTDTFTYEAVDSSNRTIEGTVKRIINTGTATVTVNNLNPDAVELNSLIDQWDGNSLNLSWSASSENYFSKYVINMGDDDQMNNSSQIAELQSISSTSHSYNANQGEKKYFTLTVYDSYGGYTESSPVFGESFYKFEKSFDTGRGNEDRLDVLIATNDGGFIAAGRSTLNTGSTPDDAVFMKINQFGQLEWGEYLGNTNTDERILGITEASNGDIILVGQYGTLTDTDMLVARYTSNGNSIWAYYYNFNTLFDGSDDGLDFAWDVYEDTNGDIHVYGASNVHIDDGYNRDFYNPALMILDSNGTYQDGTYWYWDDAEFGATSAYFQSVDHSPNIGDEMVHIDMWNKSTVQWESSIAYTEINDYKAFSWIDYYNMDIDDVKEYGDWHSIYGNGAGRNPDFIEHRGYTDTSEDFSYTMSASTNSFYELYSTHHLPVNNNQAYLATGYGLSSQQSFDNKYRGFFFRTDNAGNFEWGYQLNAFDSDEDTVFMEIAESSIDGGVLIGGYTRETSSSDWDYYFVKYNDEGQKVIVDFDNGSSRYNLDNRVSGSTSIDRANNFNDISGRNSFVVNASDNTKIALTNEMKAVNKSKSSINKMSFTDKKRLINLMKERLGY